MKLVGWRYCGTALREQFAWSLLTQVWRNQGASVGEDPFTHIVEEQLRRSIPRRRRRPT